MPIQPLFAATMLAGVLIAAGAVVTKDVKDYALMAGVPANKSGGFVSVVNVYLKNSLVHLAKKI